jgi:excisionase family DNA binding protein
MLTVPEAARRTGKNPDTIRRWIREGKLPATKVGTQHVIDEAELARISEEAILPAPAWWDETPTGEPMPDWVAVLRQQRAEH